VIPVARAAEPASFEAMVRRPGLDAIAELVGEAPSRPRRGPRRKVIAASPDQIPADKLPDLWRDVLPELREAYGNLCAYLALYIHPATGSATVDHFVPKSKDWRLVYEWSNYRLCSSVINAHKRERELKLDPFTLEPGLFALEFVELQVKPGPAARESMLGFVNDTIDVLGLNHRECIKARQEYVEQYRIGPPEGIALARLERHAPFIAQELRRQGLLVRGDA
jgi:hypothetical protein